MIISTFLYHMESSVEVLDHVHSFSINSKAFKILDSTLEDPHLRLPEGFTGIPSAFFQSIHIYRHL